MDKKEKALINNLMKNGEIDVVEIRPTGALVGFGTKDEAPAKNIDVANYYMNAPVRYIGNIVQSCVEDNVPTGDLQRSVNPDVSNGIGEAAYSVVDGKPIHNNLNLNIELAICSEIIIKRGKKQFVLLPKTVDAARVLRKYIKIPNGQHSGYGYADDREEGVDFCKPMDVYVDATTQQLIKHFSDKNGKAKNLPTAHNFLANLQSGGGDAAEYAFFNILQIMHNERLDIGDGLRHKSALNGKMKFDGFNKIINGIDPFTIMKYTMFNDHGYRKKGWAIRKENLYTTLLKSGLQTNNEMAVAMMKHELAFNEIHGKDRNNDINLFSTSGKNGVGKATRVAAAMALAEAHLHVLNQFGLEINVENLKKVIDLSRDLVFNGESFVNCEAFTKGGGSDSHKSTMCFINDIKSKCIDYVDKYGIEKLTNRKVCAR